MEPTNGPEKTHRPTLHGIPPLADLGAWLEGAMRVASLGRSAERMAVLLTPPRARPRPLRPAQRAAILGLLGGRSRKELATDLGVSQATLCVAVHMGLGVLGIRSIEAALVTAEALRRGHRRWLPLEPGLGSAAQLEVALDLCLPHVLTGAEREVTLLALDGLSNAEIGAERGGVSPRTVANQLAAVFEKLGVHGRLQLVQRLVAKPPPLRIVS